MSGILIVGQGLAGSLLAWYLLQRGVEVTVVDDGHARSSSLISHGLINPITGKRLALTPGFDGYHASAMECYESLAVYFHEEFFIPRRIVRILKDEYELGKWARKRSEGITDAYIEDFSPPGSWGPHIHDPLGSLVIRQGGMCRTGQLLTCFKRYLSDCKALRTGRVVPSDLTMGSGCVEYQGELFERVVFCEGFQAQNNLYFQGLPYNSVKGEVLRIAVDADLPEEIFNKGKWCVPLGSREWAVGATYIWEDLDCRPTTAGREAIELGLKEYLRCPFRVLEHHAGVRPVLKDQKPVLGWHPEFPRLGIMNGFGSKGFLMAPYYARHLAAVIMDDASLDADVAIDRFVA